MNACTSRPYPRLTAINKRKQQKPKVKRRTLPEFKNWLEGLREFQADDWYPSAEQWASICEAIYAIKDKGVAENGNTTVSIPPTQNTFIRAPAQTSTLERPVPVNFADPELLKQDIDTSDGGIGDSEFL